MRININMKSLGIYSGYKKNIIANSAAMEKISSGKKINSAKDNPLKIEQSENFKMQIRALEMANKNLEMQIGANVGDSIGIPFFNVSSETLGIDKLDVVNDATKALNSIDEALKNVNGCRAKYGAVQNRLENSIEITSSSSYIYEKSSSDINDADIALEMAEIARTSILMESATAMMAQSNNFPKDMLNILANLRK